MPLALYPHHLHQLRDGLTGRGCRVIHFCLLASEQTVHARLAARGVSRSSAEGLWVYPCASAACTAHIDAQYARHIDTEAAKPTQIVDEIVAILAERN